MQFSSDLIRVAHALLGAKSLLILTGAGISAESGLPTFQAAQSGFWARFSLTSWRLPKDSGRIPCACGMVHLAPPPTPKGKKPNPGHQTIIGTHATFSSTTLVTQNVDDLVRAGGKC